MKLPINIQSLLDSILGPTGISDATLRRTVKQHAAQHAGAAGSPVDSDNICSIEGFIKKINETPYKVVDSDIEKLKADGRSEDEIFELIVSAAIGAGVGRLEKTLQLIEETKGET